MNKKGKCCFCGENYNNYGNSTWGCWSNEEEKLGIGEKKRCCNKCNIDIVIPARMRLLKLNNY